MIPVQAIEYSPPLLIQSPVRALQELVLANREERVLKQDVCEFGNVHGREHTEAAERRLCYCKPLIGECPVGRECYEWLLGLLLGVTARVIVRDLCSFGFFLAEARLYGLLHTLQAEDGLGLDG